MLPDRRQRNKLFFSPPLPNSMERAGIARSVICLGEAVMAAWGFWGVGASVPRHGDGPSVLVPVSSRRCWEGINNRVRQVCSDAPPKYSPGLQHPCSIVPPRCSPGDQHPHSLLPPRIFSEPPWFGGGFGGGERCHAGCLLGWAARRVPAEGEVTCCSPSTAGLFVLGAFQRSSVGLELAKPSWVQKSSFTLCLIPGMRLLIPQEPLAARPALVHGAGAARRKDAFKKARKKPPKNSRQRSFSASSIP